MSVYETKASLDQYLLFHYADADEVLPYSSGPKEALNFPLNIVSRGIAGNEFGNSGRALDIGCAVGRSSFELSRYFSEVIGIDLSLSFVSAAESIRSTGAVEYDRLDQPPNTTKLFARRPQGSFPQRIKFLCGDALSLSPELGRFNFVLAANLIDRVANPASFLSQIGQFVLAGGLLVLTSPYTWLEEFTPPDKWLSAIFPDCRDSLGAAGRILGAEFELIKFEDVPFLIREHSRKFQYSVAQLSVWRRLDH